MGDEIIYSEDGRTYKVRGVAAKAQSVFGASQEIDLWRAHNGLSSFPEKVESSWGSVRYRESIRDGAHVDGAQEFYSYPGSSTLHAHSEYWDDGNPARDNMAAIFTGNYGLVTTGPVPAPPPPPGTPDPQPGPAPSPR